MNNPALSEYFRRSPPASLWLKRDSFLAAFLGYYIISQDERPIGLCNLANVDQHHRKAEFGIMIAPQTGPRGDLATEAVKQLFDYAFSFSGFNKLYCLVLEGRPEIEHLCKRWQFEYEGTLKQNIFFEGQFRNEKLFAMTADQYFKLKDR